MLARLFRVSARPQLVRLVATAVALALAALLAPPAAGARLGSGTYAVDTDTGKVLISRRASKRRAPASVEKLVTSAAALERLGAAFRFETRALASGQLDNGVLSGSLFIKGTGDPSFNSARLRALSRGVARTDLTDIGGRVFGDESLFDSRRGTPATGFALSGYIGPLTALAFNGGHSGRGFQTSPARFVAQRFRSELIKRDVDITRSARRGRAPADAAEIASTRSATLSSIVRRMNQVSNNFYAEQLLKFLGARIGGAGTTAEGAGVARDVSRSMGFSSRVVDGSGLSRANAISPKSVVKLLTAAQDENWFNAFYRSLPLAGRSGTLSGRMRGTAAQGRCRAKTGTLSNVSALAGYCRARSGHVIAFSILNNGVNVSAARAAQDRTVAALAAR